MNIVKLLSFANLSVTKKIYLLILVAILPISLSIFCSLLYLYKDGEQGKINVFKELTTRVAENVDNTIDDKKHQLKQISELEEIRNLLSTQEDNVSKSSAIKSLNKIQNYISSKDTKNYLVVLNKKGECLTSCNLITDIKNNRDIPFFKEPLEGKSYVNILVNEQNKKTELLISYPVKSLKDEIIGVVILKLDEKYIWSGFSKLLSDFEQGEIFLINNDNLMIKKTHERLSSNKIIIKNNQNGTLVLPQQKIREDVKYLFSDRKFINQLVNRKNELYHAVLNNRMYVYTTLPNQKWIIGIDVPKLSVLNNLLFIIIFNAVVFMIIGGITIIVALYIGKTISKPICLLTKTAQAIENGDFEQVAKIKNSLIIKKNNKLQIQTKKVTNQDDLSQLIRVVMQMAIRVEQREQNWQKQVEKLHIKLEIDQQKKMREVKNLTENEEFKNIKSIVNMLKNGT
ncbi:MAG: hypothetical protein HC836_27730 [Richelia sp. RM2_1_2]|nr:hypothetical protein [Richelia sp. RM1_1_1]NJO61893.1 hypothetical protein [Richelia sp. RM2_1_2]